MNKVSFEYAKNSNIRPYVNYFFTESADIIDVLL